MLVCPLTYEEGTTRKVYLPKGNWYDFFTGEQIEGGRELELHVEYNQIPVFVKEGAIIPLATPVDCVTKNTTFEMDIKVFGDADGEFYLYEDDFDSFVYEKEQNVIKIEKHPGTELTISKNGMETSRYIFK